MRVVGAYQMIEQCTRAPLLIVIVAQSLSHHTVVDNDGCGMLTCRSIHSILLIPIATHDGNGIAAAIYVMVVDKEFLVNIKHVRYIALEGCQFRCRLAIILCLDDSQCSLLSHSPVGHAMYAATYACYLSPEERAAVYRHVSVTRHVGRSLYSLTVQLTLAGTIDVIAYVTAVDEDVSITRNGAVETTRINVTNLSATVDVAPDVWCVGYLLLCIAVDAC